jgi:hypothetical protein
MIRNNVNLSDPEAVARARNKNWSNGHKILGVYAYNEFAKMEYGLQKSHSKRSNLWKKRLR